MSSHLIKQTNRKVQVIYNMLQKKQTDQIRRLPSAGWTLKSMSLPWFQSWTKRSIFASNESTVPAGCCTSMHTQSRHNTIWWLGSILVRTLDASCVATFSWWKCLGPTSTKRQSLAARLRPHQPSKALWPPRIWFLGFITGICSCFYNRSM